jgi:hypothetical protein
MSFSCDCPTVVKADLYYNQAQCRVIHRGCSRPWSPPSSRAEAVRAASAQPAQPVPCTAGSSTPAAPSPGCAGAAVRSPRPTAGDGFRIGAPGRDGEVLQLRVYSDRLWFEWRVCP